MTPEQLLTKLIILEYFFQKVRDDFPSNTDYYKRWSIRLHGYKLKLINKAKEDWEQSAVNEYLKNQELSGSY
jgi:hypothetical protein